MTITQSRSGQLILSRHQFEAVGFKYKDNVWEMPIFGKTSGPYKLDTITAHIINDNNRWYLKADSTKDYHYRTELNIHNKDKLFELLDVLRVKYYIRLSD